MKRLIVFCVLLIFYAYPLFAQNTKTVNLIVNGDFENGNKNFHSDFIYGTRSLVPGQYSVTSYAPGLNKDYVNPVRGDHTSGQGNFLIIDSDGYPGKKSWCQTVNVIANSNYTFSAYFCNLYKFRGRDTGFDVGEFHPKMNDTKIKVSLNNIQIGQTERDIFHLFKWVKVSATWYSGTHSGPMSICIENLNAKSSGNDLAIDDIEFNYIETMPIGYKPPQKHFTIMVHDEEYNQASKLAAYKRTNYIQLKELFMGDSLSPGIHTLYPKEKYKHPDTSLLKAEQKVQFKNLIFEQGKSEIPKEAFAELDNLAEWMRTNPSIRIRMEGHTDNMGIQELNVKLSEERVLNVKQYLVDKGINENRIETIGYGGSYPIGDNSQEETKKMNRRVEFEILVK